MDDSCRMSIELTHAERAMLDRLMVQTEARSRTEVICRAIKVMHDIVPQGRLVIRRPDGTECEVLI
jgi:hypothetical protein